ncbi:hypothetical protein ACFQI7_28175 [Paenibacillus allorhizosphaerae]|uniref:hypothetical protein n=1 Tax=Paenibacillus allorhizosphaerae TaxID=2849866 RepID=UPI001C404828|nr:hypothetical protein [Paenibacillus allorhizosphaerae]
MISIYETEEKYRFDADAPNKIVPKARLKAHSNVSRKLWKLLKSHNCKYYGVVRDFTSVFSYESTFLVVHHFPENDPPDERLIERDSKIRWEHVFAAEEFSYDLFTFLENENFRVFLPIQT